MFRPTPSRIPISRGKARHAIKVPRPGIRSLSANRGKEIIINFDFESAFPYALCSFILEIEIHHST